MTNKRRVFISGYGTVNRFGSGDRLADHLIGPALADDLPNTYPAGNLDSDAYGDGKVTRRMDRFTLLAYQAVKQALEMAGVDAANMNRERTGLIMNTCYGPLDSTRRYIAKLIRDGAKKVPAAVFPNTVHNAFTGLITMDLHAVGSNSTVSGQNPIAYGLDMIREGKDEMMIVGGCDELLSALENGFSEVGMFCRSNDGETQCNVDKKRNGFVLGEGAAVLILESEESLRARGATALAEILDYGMANGIDGCDTTPFPADADGMSHAMRQALDRSGLNAGQVDMVSAASNGLPRVTQAEVVAMGDVFGTGNLPPVCNAKAALGETLGAASTFSAALAIDILRANSASHGWRDSAAGQLLSDFLDRATAPETVLINSVELGGTITSLAVRATPATNQ